MAPCMSLCVCLNLKDLKTLTSHTMFVGYERHFMALSKPLWLDMINSNSFSLNSIFTQSKANSSLFYLHTSHHFIILLIYVDDILFTGSSPRLLNRFVHQLHHKFVIRDLGDVHCFLGIQISGNPNGFHFSLSTYVANLLKWLSLQHLKPAPTLMTNESTSSSSSQTALVDPSLYRSTIGSLHYLLLTRPDITFAIDNLSQHCQTPIVAHWQALKLILRYLQGTPTLGLLL